MLEIFILGHSFSKADRTILRTLGAAFIAIISATQCEMRSNMEQLLLISNPDAAIERSLFSASGPPFSLPPAIGELDAG
jgi:hypothetical protein